MQLDKYEIENLLNKFGEIIDEGDFEGLFRKLFKDLDDPRRIGALSTFFYDSGLNYLEDMDYVPVCAFYESDLPALTIPNNVHSIEDYAFANSTIPVINIPASVQEIADNAFYGSSIGEINFNGKKDQWYDLNARVPRATKVNFK